MAVLWLCVWFLVFFIFPTSASSSAGGLRRCAGAAVHRGAVLVQCRGAALPRRPSGCYGGACCRRRLRCFRSSWRGLGRAG